MEPRSTQEGIEHDAKPRGSEIAKKKPSNKKFPHSALKRVLGLREGLGARVTPSPRKERNWFETRTLP